MAWLPEPAPLKGPDRATAEDIDALNKVFSEAFTDRYRRDGLSGMRVPHLNPLVWPASSITTLSVMRPCR